MYYISDALMYISQNTANSAGGKAIGIRYYDIVNPKPKETRTAEEIIDHIKEKLGG